MRTLLIISFTLAYLMSLGQGNSTITDQESQARLAYQAENTGQAIQLYNKVAYYYWDNHDNDNATRVYLILLELNKKSNNQNGVYSVCNSLALLYSDKNDYANALLYFKRALELSKRTKVTSDITSCLVNVASTLQNSGNYKDSYPYLSEALVLSLELGELKLIRRTYGLLAQYYEKTGDSDQAFTYYEKFASVDKKIKAVELEAMQKSADLKVADANAQKLLTQIKLLKTSGKLKQTEDSLEETERVSHERKMQIDLRNTQIREKDSQIKYEHKIRNILIAGLIVIGGFLVLLGFFLIERIRSNKLLNKKNIEIEKQGDKIRKQKEKLEIQHNKITDSINYALTIQNTVLPIRDVMDKYMNYFLIYRPKDIVSGDFYWFSPINENDYIVAVLDCTGHGVPGAFMSLIGHRLLSEIIFQKNEHEPSKILSLLNLSLYEALRQDSNNNTDGMDVCLCRVSKTSENKFALSFAGAKRPLFVYSAKEDTVELLSGSPFSTGSRYALKQEISYIQHDIVLQPGDEIVLSSDGVIDQPGPGRKRYGTQRFVDTLKTNIHESTNIQHEQFCIDFDSYTKLEEQRDDITVLAINF